MQYTIALEIANAISDEGCSLDELVTKIKAVFVEEGFPGFVALLLRVIDEALCVASLKGSTSHLNPCGCAHPRLESKGLKPRSFRTSIGKVKIKCRHLRCRSCRATQVPLCQFLKIDPYQRKTAELEEIVADVVGDQSFRRSSAHLEIVGQIVVPKSTLHDWIKATTCDEVANQRHSVGQIFADGTGFKRRAGKEPKSSNRGQVKVMLGIDHQGNTIPMGAWSGESWAEIGELVHPREKAGEKQLYLADNLVVDGEAAIAEGLEHLAENVQRCHWHLSRDLGFSMWQNGAPLEERKAQAKQLSRLIAIELPEGDVDTVSKEDKKALLDHYERTEEEIDRLIEALDKKGYGAAATYVSNAKRDLFTYLGAWLDLGIRCPRTNSLIERIMREVGRRLKRIAFGWSEAGAAKMTRIVLAKLLAPREWEAYWQKRKRLEGNAIILFKGARIVS